MTELEVINELLGSMGENPLNSLAEPHAFKQAAQAKLKDINDRIQSKGWWFNTEYLTLKPSAVDGNIYLPGDTLEVRNADRMIVARGSRLFKRDEGSFVFDEDHDVTLIRRLPFPELPHTAATHISAMALLEFQTTYDGDSEKTRELRQRIESPYGTLALLQAEETRSQMLNLNAANDRLQRLKLLTSRVRHYARRR